VGPVLGLWALRPLVRPTVPARSSAGRPPDALCRRHKVRRRQSSESACLRKQHRLAAQGPAHPAGTLPHACPQRSPRKLWGAVSSGCARKSACGAQSSAVKPVLLTTSR
jgi:phage tail protein X